jgi:FkbM family methyltransferase
MTPSIRQIRRQIERESCVVSVDGDVQTLAVPSKFSHSPLEYPAGQWVTPIGLVRPLAGVLAEQTLDVYGCARPGEIIVDCGAHFGGFTRRVLEEGAAHVVAFEMVPIYVTCFRRNCDQTRVTLHEKAVWSETTTVILEQPPARFSRGYCPRVFARGGLGTPVPAVALDDVLLALPRVDCIKMDIEGAERHALLGARRTVQQFRPRLILCSYHLADDVPVLTQLVREIAPAYRVQTTFDGMFLDCAP